MYACSYERCGADRDVRGDGADGEDVGGTGWRAWGGEVAGGEDFSGFEEIGGVVAVVLSARYIQG